MAKKSKRKIMPIRCTEDTNKVITGHSLMQLPYANVYYAKNCLDYLIENCGIIKTILEKGKFELIEKSDLEVLNNLVPLICNQADYIKNYIVPSPVK